MNFSIPSETLQKVVDYLVTRPFSEVFQLIGDIQTKAKEIKETEEKKGV